MDLSLIQSTVLPVIGQEREQTVQELCTRRVISTSLSMSGHDFVIINKHELPEHESQAVQDILPKELPASAGVNSNHSAVDIDECNKSVSCTPDAGCNNLTRSMDAQVNDPLFSRQFISNPRLTGINDLVNKQFSVASYNILADCHALRGIHEWGQYKWCTEENLAFAHRQVRLHEELKYLDADILCLQEVSPTYFHDVLLPTFQKEGYEGFFIKREAEDHDEGEASFYRTSCFTLVNSQGFVLHNLAEKEMTAMDLTDQTKEVVLNRVRAPGVLLTMQLECKKTGTIVTVGNIHVTWGEFKFPDQQSVQIACAIKEIVSQAGGADKPHIICGDFNSVPTSPGYLLARDGYLTDETLSVLQNMKELEVPGQQEKCALVDLWWKGFQHPSNSLQSSYYLTQGSEPMSSKFPHDGGLRSVDFIWFSADTFNLHGVLELLPSKLIENGIPNDIAPSDHLSTKAVFSLK